MRVLCVIPARLESRRLPQKPLRLLDGVPLVCHVGRRVSSWNVCQRLIVASDAPAVVRAARQAGLDAIRTTSAPRSGTERVAEIIEQEEFRCFDLILNIQGDEPFLPREAAVGSLERVRGGDPIGTASAPLGREGATDPARVKVVVGRDGRALYFSRSMVPYGGHAARPPPGGWRQHLGVYAYTRSALSEWATLPPVSLEEVEGLEQLRPLWYGIPIGVAPLSQPASRGIDTEVDLRWAQEEMRRTNQQPREVHA